MLRKAWKEGLFKEVRKLGVSGVHYLQRLNPGKYTTASHDVTVTLMVIVAQPVA